LLGAEAFNFLGLYEREVLSGVLMDSKVPVTDNPHPTLKRYPVALNLRGATLGAREDAFNDHRLLLTPNV